MCVHPALQVQPYARTDLHFPFCNSQGYRAASGQAGAFCSDALIPYVAHKQLDQRLRQQPQPKYNPKCKPNPSPIAVLN